MTDPPTLRPTRVAWRILAIIGLFGVGGLATGCGDSSSGVAEASPDGDTADAPQRPTAADAGPSAEPDGADPTGQGADSRIGSEAGDTGPSDDDTAAATPELTPITQGEAVAVLASLSVARCAGVDACCWFGEDCAGFAGKLEAFFTTQVASALSDGLHLDNSALNACLGAAETLDCDSPSGGQLGFGCSNDVCAGYPLGLDKGEEACRRILRGSQPSGATCQGDLDCTGPDICITLLGQGSSCAPPGQLGASCLLAVDCAGDLDCAATCGPVPGLGDSCFGSHRHCSGLGCQAGTCDWGLGCVDGACVLLGAVGDPCSDSIGGPSCGAGLYCDGGHCAEQLPTGAACGPLVGDEPCQGWCDEQTCAARNPPGEPCEGSEECVGVCLSSGSCSAVPSGSLVCLGLMKE